MQYRDNDQPQHQKTLSIAVDFTLICSTHLNTVAPHPPMGMMLQQHQPHTAVQCDHRLYIKEGHGFRV